MEILPIIILITTIIFIIYIFNTIFSKQKELFNTNYTAFTNNNKDLDKILKSFTSLTYKPNYEIKNVSESYILSENNMDFDIKKDIETIIKKILDSINTAHKTKYILSNLERLKIQKNILKEQQFSVIFFIYEKNKFSARKVFLQYRKSPDNKIVISHIRAVQSGEKGTFENKYFHDEYYQIDDKLIMDEQLNLFQDVCCKKQKCKHNLKLYTASEHGIIDLKLKNNCVINKLPEHISRPFVNPTMFATP